jgi:hypothetical protein
MEYKSISQGLAEAIVLGKELGQRHLDNLHKMILVNALLL